MSSFLALGSCPVARSLGSSQSQLLTPPVFTRIIIHSLVRHHQACSSWNVKTFPVFVFSEEMESRIRPATTCKLRQRLTAFPAFQLIISPQGNWNSTELLKFSTKIVKEPEFMKAQKIWLSGENPSRDHRSIMSGYTLSGTLCWYRDRRQSKMIRTGPPCSQSITGHGFVGSFTLYGLLYSHQNMCAPAFPEFSPTDPKEITQRSMN